MGAFKNAIITKKGKALLAKAVNGTASLNFTSVRLSENVLSGDIESKTSIGSVKQEINAPSVVRQNGSDIKVTAIFDNDKLTAGYYVRNIGLYANDPQEGEILFSISVADESVATADWMPVFSGVGVSSFVAEQVISVSNASTVNVSVDFSGSATVAQLIALQEQVDNTIATTTDIPINNGVAGGGLKLNHIKGASSQKILSGKNKFYCTTSFSNKNFGSGIKVKAQELTSNLMIDGTATVEHSIPISSGMHLSKGTYTVSVTGLANHNSSFDRLYISSGVGSVNYVQKDLVQILTLAEDAEVDVHILFKEGSSYTETLVQVQIEEGEKSSATDYEEYCGGMPSPSPNYPQAIKNTFECVELADYRDTLYLGTVGYFSKYLIPCKSLDVIQVVSEFPFMCLCIFYDKYKKDLADAVAECKPTCIVPEGAHYFSVIITDNFKPYNQEVPSPRSEGKLAVTLNGRYIAQITNSYKQLAEEPLENFVRDRLEVDPITFFLDEPLRSTDSIIRRADGVIGVMRKRATKVLNGSEQWEIAGTASHGYQSFYTPLPDVERVGETRRGEIKSNKFRSLSLSIWNNPTGYYTSIGTGEPYAYISVKTTDASNVSELKEWLAENNVEIEYPLAIPVFTPLDTETQLAINSMITFNNLTYIDVISRTPPSEVEVEYGTSKVGGYALKSLLNTENIALKLSETV